MHLQLIMLAAIVYDHARYEQFDALSHTCLEHEGEKWGTGA
jgi:hypothetical protein